MRYVDPWPILAIDPTTDVRLIRRAYAARLKLVHPEDDPEGFQTLREAYDIAMARAQPRASAAQRVGPVRMRRKARKAPPVRFDPAGFADEPEDLDPIGDLDIAPRPEPAPQPAPTPEPTPAPDPAPSPKIAPVPLSPPETPLVYERFSAPPEQSAPARPTLPEADRKAFDAARQALMDLLRGSNRPARESVVAATETLLSSAAMQSIQVHDRTERWLSDLVLSDVVGAEYILAPADRHFRWLNSDVRRTPLSMAIGRRQDEIERFARVSSPSAPLARAWLALTDWSPKKSAFEVRISPGLRDDVATVLKMAETDRFLARRLNPAAVAWWRDWHSRPRMPGWGLQVALLGVIVATIWQLSQAQPAPVVLVTAIVAAAVGLIGNLAWVHLYLAPRRNWEREKDRLPAWAEWLWAPVSLGLFVAAAFVPPSRFGVFAFGVLAVGVFLCAAVVAQPDRSQVRADTRWNLDYISVLTLGLWLTQWLWRPAVRYPWWVRTIFAFFWLALLWWIALPFMNDGFLNQVLIPLIAAFAAFSLGAETLTRLWERQPTNVRALGLAVTLSIATLGLSAMWGWTGGVVVMSVAVFLHKPMGARLSGKAQIVRELALRFGWIVWPILIASFNPTIFDQPWWGMVLGSLVVWTGILIVVIAQAREIMFPTRKRRPGELA